MNASGAAMMPAVDDLTDQEKIFVAGYLRHFNASRAAREAGCTPKAAPRSGYRWLREPNIKAAIEKNITERTKLPVVDADRVIRQWLDLATADPNELMQVRRTCCRFCHGEGGRHQRTQNERDRAWADWEVARQLHEARGGDLAEPYPDFDEAGGVGYDATREPNEKCIECWGEGVVDVHVADSRDLSPQGRALFAGVKQTKDGIEVKMHSQEKAWELLGKHLGLLKERVEVEGNVSFVERIAAVRKRNAASKNDDGSDLAG